MSKIGSKAELRRKYDTCREKAERLEKELKEEKRLGRKANQRILHWKDKSNRVVRLKEVKRKEREVRREEVKLGRRIEELTMGQLKRSELARELKAQYKRTLMAERRVTEILADTKKTRNREKEIDRLAEGIKGDEVHQILLDNALDEVERLKGWLLATGDFKRDLHGNLHHVRKG